MIHTDGMPHKGLAYGPGWLSNCGGHLQYEVTHIVSSGSVQVYVCDYCGEHFINYHPTGFFRRIFNSFMEWWEMNF